MSEDRRGQPPTNTSNTSSTSNTSNASGASGGVQVVPVRVAGHEYKIRSSGDPEQLQQIAGYVDRAMKRVRERTGTVDTLDVAVLTCLNLGREILGLRERGEESAGAAVDPTQLRSLIERVEAIVSVERATSDVAPDSEDASAPAQHEDGAARTLELPSVEALRDRQAQATGQYHGENETTADGAESEAEEGLEQSRIAAGGRRDRAS